MAVEESERIVGNASRALFRFGTCALEFVEVMITKGASGEVRAEDLLKEYRLAMRIEMNDRSSISLNAA